MPLLCWLGGLFLAQYLRYSKVIPLFQCTANIATAKDTIFHCVLILQVCNLSFLLYVLMGVIVELEFSNLIQKSSPDGLGRVYFGCTYLQCMEDSFWTPLSKNLVYAGIIRLALRNKWMVDSHSYSSKRFWGCKTSIRKPIFHSFFRVKSRRGTYGIELVKSLSHFTRW